MTTEKEIRDIILCGMTTSACANAPVRGHLYPILCTVYLWLIKNVYLIGDRKGDEESSFLSRKVK